MIYKFIIPGRLDGLNEYTKANRSNRYQGGKMKTDNETVIMEAIKTAQANGFPKTIATPIGITCNWYEPNNRRDIDNVVFAIKFIQDSLVTLGVIPDDSRKYITKLAHQVFTDKNNPRVEVIIESL